MSTDRQANRAARAAKGLGFATATTDEVLDSQEQEASRTAPAGRFLPEPCLLCHKAPGTGHWRLCPSCRRELARRSAERQSRMLLDHCTGCLTPKRGPPKRGSLYCPRCRLRFCGKGERP
jgi:hypothetical protein